LIVLTHGAHGSRILGRKSTFFRRIVALTTNMAIKTTSASDVEEPLWEMLDFSALRRGPVVRARGAGEFGVPRMPRNQAPPKAQPGPMADQPQITSHTSGIAPSLTHPPLR
jgi:hypothetical protein